MERFRICLSNGMAPPLISQGPGSDLSPSMKPFVLKADSESVNLLLQQLIHLNTIKAVDSSVASSALTAVISAYPPAIRGRIPRSQTSEGFRSVKKEVLPRFMPEDVSSVERKKSRKSSTSEAPRVGRDTSTLEVLIEVIRVFGGLMEPREVQGLLDSLFSDLEDPAGPSIQKKLAVQGIAQLTAHLDDGALSSLVTSLINRFTNSHASQDSRRNRIYLIGSIARVIPVRFGPQLKALAPFVLSPVSAEEADDESDDDDETLGRVEIRETSLLALEILHSACAAYMDEFLPETCQAALRYIGYDPNVLSDDETGAIDGSDEDAEEEDDSEEEDEELADSEDESWKLRRASAKLLTAMITTPESSMILKSAPLFSQLLSQLASRLKEREENVRIEVVNTLKSLVIQVGLLSGLLPTNQSNDPIDHHASHTNKRKRRRADSDLSASQTISRPGPGVSLDASYQEILGRMRASCATIVRSSVKTLRSAPAASKQAVIELLTTLVSVSPEEMSEQVKSFLEPIAETAKSYSSNSSGPDGGAAHTTASSGSIQRIALTCMSTTFMYCKASTIRPYLPKVVPIILAGIDDRFHKTAEEAIRTAEQLIKNITGSTSFEKSPEVSKTLSSLDGQLTDRMKAGNADVGVRGKAIIALGVLYARALDLRQRSPISEEKTHQLLWSLAIHLKSELLRPSVLISLNRITASFNAHTTLPNGWVQEVALELASYLRKSDAGTVRRNMMALRNVLCSSAPPTRLDHSSAQGICSAVLPLMSSNDITVVKCCLETTAILLRTASIDGTSTELENSLGKLAATALSGQQLDLLTLVYTAIGGTPGAKQMMKATLAIGTLGDPLVIGRLSGTLLMNSDGNVGYRIPDFINEVKNAPDDLRRCLALAVVGTIGHLQGNARDIKPELFVPFFSSSSEKVALSAATAFGRAASSHLEEYTAVMFKNGSTKDLSQHHFLYSIKEIISNPEADINPYSDRFWDYVLAASLTETNRAVAAECLGRLAASDPARFLPRIEELLKSTDSGKRGTAIAAIRFVLTELDDTYDEHLRPILGSSICQMLVDSELTNVRAALLTLHSAIRHTPHLLASHLNQLLPLVLRQAVVHRELIRQVSVGPFKIDVDDGLETRRTAYETLFAIVSNPSLAEASIVLQIMPRIAAGYADDQDIRSQSNLMLQKAITVDRSAVKPHLALFEESFKTVLSTKLKDNAVRQETEALDAACKIVCGATRTLNELLRKSGEPRWESYMQWLRKERPHFYAEVY